MEAENLLVYFQKHMFIATISAVAPFTNMV